MPYTKQNLGPATDQAGAHLRKLPRTQSIRPNHRCYATARPADNQEEEQSIQHCSIAEASDDVQVSSKEVRVGLQTITVRSILISIACLYFQYNLSKCQFSLILKTRFDSAILTAIFFLYRFQ